MTGLLEKLEWQSLQKHCDDLNGENSIFSMSISMEALNWECFHPRVTDEIKDRLIKLSYACQLPERVEDLFQGKIVNVSANLPALHTQLRESPLADEYRENLNLMREISRKIQDKKWMGYTGKPIQNILHIGIGGSDLSQRLVCYALEKYTNTDLEIYFVANIDPHEMDRALKKLNPETTLVIIASKSFSTLETQMNMDSAMEWLKSPQAIQKQVVVITAYPEKIMQRYSDVLRANIIKIPLGIGGRYSIWSAMGLIAMIAIGYENFQDFLKGGHAMDEHFRYTPYEKNIPVLLGLFGVWNINFLHCETHAIIPYAERLRYLPVHLQQLDMESNGKSKTAFGEEIDYATGPVIWGGVGSNSQHSFHQLLHQGTHTIPVDFIMVQHSKEEMSRDQRFVWLNSNCQTQIQAMAKNPRCLVNLITLNGLTPYSLGALIALYEHKVFVQSQIWSVNPFDQPGVEEAKTLAKKMMLG